MARHHPSPSRSTGRWSARSRALVAPSLLIAVACSSSWENEHLFSSGTPQIQATASRAGNPNLPEHYLVSWNGAVGKKGFATVGVSLPMPGEPLAMEVGDVNGDGADDIVVLFAEALGGVAETPRLHVQLQRRTESSIGMGAVLLLPPLPTESAPGGAHEPRVEIENGELLLHFAVPLKTENRTLAFDFEADRWDPR